MDADGVELGYTDIFEAVNDTALAVVSRIAADPTKAIFGEPPQPPAAQDSAPTSSRSTPASRRGLSQRRRKLALQPRSPLVSRHTRNNLL